MSNNEPNNSSGTVSSGERQEMKAPSIARLASGRHAGVSDRLAKHGLLDLLPRVRCADGTSLSVQASRTHYCCPRDNGGRL